MARISADEAAKMIGSRFDLVIVAAQRARELRNGSPQRIEGQDHSTTVTALREIEAGLYTKEEFLEKLRKKGKL